MVRYKHFDHAFDRIYDIATDACICFNYPDEVLKDLTCPTSILLPQATSYAYAMENSPDRPAEE